MKYRKNPLKDLAKLLSGESTKEKIRNIKANAPKNPLLKKGLRFSTYASAPSTPYHF